MNIDSHIPVLYGELLQSLHFFRPGENVVVDATLGLGGHAIGVLQKLTTGDIFIGLDCDTGNLETATQRILSYLKDIPRNKQPTVYCIHANFRDLKEVLSNIQKCESINRINGVNKINGITCLYADLGVSSVHFDTPERGFSFRFDGPLDMRLDIHQEYDARKLINSLPYEKMAEIFRVYGDEPKAGFITKKILEYRKTRSITTTQELRKIVESISRDALPRIFQALRIAVNDEYGALESLLKQAYELLSPSGILAIISFHSGEDRIVKHFFREKSTPERDLITGQDISHPTFEVLTKKPITPTEAEIQKNPRSRSALLRIGRREFFEK